MRFGCCAWGSLSLLDWQGFALAVNPAYIDTTVFDNDAFAGMMAGFGLVCAALGPLSAGTGGTRPESSSASLMQACWLPVSRDGPGRMSSGQLVAMAFSALVLLRGRILRPVSHWIAAALGCAIGGLLFLIYQVRSRGGTWQAIDEFLDRSPLKGRLYARLVLFAETLVSDREHRAMWGDIRMGDFERWLPVAVVLTACAVCLLMRGTQPFGRFCSLSFLLSLSALLFASLHARSRSIT